MAEKKPIEPGVIARAVAGVRYAITGKQPDWMGPGQPIAPQAQQPADGGGAAGRQFDFPVGFNYQLQAGNEGNQDTGISYSMMRNLADNFDLLRLVIETRKDQMAKLRWKFGYKEEVAKAKKIEKRRKTILEEHERKVKAQAEEAATVGSAPVDPSAPPPPPKLQEPKLPEMPEADPVLDGLNAMFQFPDQEHDWETWLRALLEDLLVIDAPALYPRFTLGGDVTGFDLVDGSTIKRIIDQGGRTPEPPDVAYQQILKGMAAVDYSKDELVFRPRNVRTHKVYGYSPVEQIIMTVNIALRRQIHQLQFYTEGTVPDMFIGVPNEWSADTIKKFQFYFDSLMEGDTAARRKARFIPGGVTPFPLKDPKLKDEMDDWLARVICYAFNVSSQSLVKEMNRATAESAFKQANLEGLQPLMNWVRNLMNFLVWKYTGNTDVEFKWEEEESMSPKEQMEVLTGYVKAKVIDADEARDTLGKDPMTEEQRERANPPAPPMVPGGPPGNAPPGAGNGPGSGDQGPAKGQEGQKLGKAVAASLRKASASPISRNRKAAREARSEIEDVVMDVLTDTAASVGKQIAASLSKASNKDRAKKIVDDLDLDALDDIEPELARILRALVEDAGEEGLKSVLNESTADMLEQVNDFALAYAEDRSAELIRGLKDSTRDMVRGTVTEALEGGWSNDQLAAALSDLYGFSDVRAEVIARTETAYADVQGNLEGWRASGVVSGKRWITDPNNPCDMCEELGGVEVDLDDDFPEGGGDGPPLHPNCECDVIPILKED